MSNRGKNWSFHSIESINPVPESSRLSRCIASVCSLRMAWSQLEIPQLWIDYMQRPLPEYIGALPAFENLVGRGVLHILSNQLMAVPDEALEQRSPYGPAPSFFLTCRRYCEWNRIHEHPSVAWDQLSQFLVYQSSEHTAESAIVMALDGIPSTLIRKRPSAIDITSGKALEPEGADYSVLYTPICPTTRRSRKRMRHLPICRAHPALILCSKGPTAWRGSTDPPGSLSAILNSMASTATISLDSMTNAWSLRTGQMTGQLQLSCPSDIPELAGNSEHALPDWAFLLGIIYDAESIHFVAHIPYIPEGKTEYHYLSLLFETLPFPANDTANCIQDSFRDRYRVALAFLCLQHHIFRLTALWDGVIWPPDVVQEPLDFMRGFTDFWCDTPTPSQPPSNFMPLPPGFEIDGFDDEDDDPTHISDPVAAPVKVRPRVDEWLETLEGCSFEQLEPWAGIM